MTVHEFNRYLPVQVPIKGTVDGPHAAISKQSIEPVAIVYCLANQTGHNP
jgi:hypothetical protein